MHRSLTNNLYLESAHYLHHVAKFLAELFPDAKFILTYRDPRTWVESEMNQNLRMNQSPYWRGLESFRYSKHGDAYENQEIAKFPGVYPVRNYLKYWQEHVSTVVSSVAPERLFCQNVSTLNENVEAIAKFVEVGPNTLDASKKHSGVRQVSSIRLYEYVSPEIVDEMANEICPLFDYLQSTSQ